MANENGGILILALILIAVMLVFGIAQVKLVSISYQKGRKYLCAMKAHYMAEAGLERAIVTWMLDEAANQWYTLQHTAIFTDEPFAGGTFSVVANGVDDSTATLHCSGNWHGTHQTIQVTLRASWNRNPPVVRILSWQEN